MLRNAQTCSKFTHFMGFIYGCGEVARLFPLNYKPQTAFTYMYEILYTCLSHQDLEKSHSVPEPKPNRNSVIRSFILGTTLVLKQTP